MFNYNDSKRNRYIDASYYYNKSNQYGKISPVKNYEIQMIGTRTELKKISSQLA